MSEVRHKRMGLNGITVLKKSEVDELIVRNEEKCFQNTVRTKLCTHYG